MNVSDLYKIFTELKETNKKERIELSNYIKKIASTADSIASYWEEIAKQVVEEEPFTDEKLIYFYDKIKKELKCPANFQYYWELERFYRYSSRALGDKLSSEWLNEIISFISSILYNRNKAKSILININKEIQNSALFINEENNNIWISDLFDCINILRKEAAALTVLSHNILLESNIK